MKRSRMTLQAELIYRPGTKIEVVFEMDSDTPIVLPSLLYECDHQAMQMTIAQTRPEILPSLQSKNMTVTTLVNDELHRKCRAGVDCRILEFSKTYRLSNNKTASAIRIGYTPDSLQIINIRSAYRFRPNTVFRVDSTIRNDASTFLSERDFKIDNISFTGIGLLIPRQVGGVVNPMMDVVVGQTLTIELRLIDTRENPRDTIMTCDVVVVRKESEFNRKSGFAGVRLTGLSHQDVEKLSRFIHHAQLHEIRAASGL